MGADSGPKRQKVKDATEVFLWVIPKAIARYAEWRFDDIARRVRHILEQAEPSGIFDLPNANQWREYCYQVNFGPTELEVAFDELVDPLVDFRVEGLPQEEAVLLSIAQQWATDALEHQDGRTVSPDLIRRGARLALRQLASATDSNFWDG